jgi:hypothetical protein
VLERKCDGIANTETHAEVGRSEDAHTGQVLHKLLYVVKLSWWVYTFAPWKSG